MGTNVILITMDTLRADHLGCYGDTQIQTPTLDAPADGIRCFRTCSKPYASQGFKISNDVCAKSLTLRETSVRLKWSAVAANKASMVDR
ncbi:MAG: hypothetical protein ACRD23_13915, partial [Terriglobales bacterium]